MLGLYIIITTIVSLYLGYLWGYSNGSHKAYTDAIEQVKKAREDMLQQLKF